MIVTGKSLVAEAKRKILELAPEEVAHRLSQQTNLALIDVRETEEYAAGSIEKAVNIPRGFLELRVESIVSDREKPIILYCAGGNRSALAAETMLGMGYKDVVSMSGGYSQWVNEGRTVVTPAVLNESQKRRYARHLTLPEVGEAGQTKLLASRVLLIGAGGLGSPVAFYLAAAGVGTIGIVDSDVVEESNLQRQILHSTKNIGISKTESAKQTLLAYSPATQIVAIDKRVSASNVEEILRDYDLVVDGSDNFPTRYLINDACVRLGKPCVHGSVYRFEGQVSVFDSGKGTPCYRCLFPVPPSPEFAPSCAEAGVLGVLPGIIGLLQAIETLKWLLGIGDGLAGRLLTFNGLETRFQEFRIKRDPECMTCSQNSHFEGYVDYQVTCATS